MKSILSTFKLPFALVYFNHSTIFIKLIQEHLDYIQTVLGLLLRGIVTMKLKSCLSCRVSIDGLGHVFMTAGLTISTSATYETRGLVHPTNVTELKSLIGLDNVFTLFVTKFGKKL